VEELKAVFAAVLRADSLASMTCALDDSREVQCMSQFPSEETALSQFFERVVTESEYVRKHVITFAIHSSWTLQELKMAQSRSLQEFLKVNRTHLKEHKFETLLIEQIGWFACKLPFAYLDRMEHDLSQEISRSISRINAHIEGLETEISYAPKFELDRSTVYESLNGSNRVQAIGIKCEVGEAATLKRILLQSDINANNLGSFIPVATRLANPQLHRTMFNKHAAFINDMVTIHVEGLHDDVLDELMHCGSTPETEITIREILKLTELQDVCPVWTIEYTEESEEDGKFLFVTSKENAELVESVVNNQLQQMASSTLSFAKHRNKNESYRAGIRVVPRRPNRRTVYESKLHSFYKDVTEAESASARQGSRNRPTTVQDVRWTTVEFPPLQSGNFVPVAAQRTYSQAAQTQVTQQNRGQKIGDQFRLGQHQRANAGSIVAGGTSNTRTRSVTSDLGNDDATIMTTLQEQSATTASARGKAQETRRGN
jgi:hypothetical protein